MVSFTTLDLAGGTVDFGGVADWSQPPILDPSGTPCAVLKLPPSLSAGSSRRADKSKLRQLASSKYGQAS
jgi:hypothetical protein